MGLVLNEEQRLLRESARELLSVKSPVSALRALRDTKDESGFSRELWRELVELGWSGMTLPENVGGLDFGFQGLAVTFEEAGRTLAATPLLSTVVLGAGLIEKLGTPNSNGPYCQRLLTAAGCSLSPWMSYLGINLRTSQLLRSKTAMVSYSMVRRRLCLTVTLQMNCWL